MIFNEYELVLIIRPDVDDAVTVGTIEKFEGIIAENGGHHLYRDNWGKRKMAYPIQKHLKGHYVVENFLGPVTLVAELERNLRLSDKVIRFMTVKLDAAVDATARIQQAAERREAEKQAAASESSESEEWSKTST